MCFYILCYMIQKNQKLIHDTIHDLTTIEMTLFLEQNLLFFFFFFFRNRYNTFKWLLLNVIVYIG